MGVDVAVAGSYADSGTKHGEAMVLGGDQTGVYPSSSDRAYPLPIYTNVSGKYDSKFDDVGYY